MPGSIPGAVSGMVFNIMRYALHDGPGVRTTVFLKGCPLRCWWCHNPESQESQPTPLWASNRCLHCHDCVRACPEHAIRFEDGAPQTSEACTRCGQCTDACLAGARQLAGTRMTVAEVVAECGRDSLLYDESGGGVTISGGEPLCQPQFTVALLEACRDRRIHAALDTCGFADRDTLLQVSAAADLVLYDLKLLDPEAHRRYTGVSNTPILDNLAALAAAGRDVIVRVPVIPGVNDRAEHLEAVADFVWSAGLRRIDLLPYHRIAADKYGRLGRSSPMGETESLPASALGGVAGELAARGFAVRIGG